MPRTNLDRGLQELHTQAVHLGSRVEQSLTKTLKSLETGDHTSFLYQPAHALSQKNSSALYSVDLSPMDPEGNITDTFILRGLLNYDASLLQRMPYLLWIAHLLKQMANHATDMGKQIIFIEEGEDKII